MTVYLTKKVLSKMNILKYPYNVPIEDEEGSSGDQNDHWQKLMSETKYVSQVIIKNTLLNILFIECLIYRKKLVQLGKDLICRVCARSGCIPLSDKIEGYEIMSTIRSLTNISVCIV